MIGESVTRSYLQYRTLWAYSYRYYSLSAATPQERVLWGDLGRCFASGGPGSGYPCLRGWGSFHAGGLHFLFCDGAVRFLSTDIDMSLLCDLATIAGGEVAQVPQD